MLTELTAMHADALSDFLRAFELAGETAIPAYFPRRDLPAAEVAPMLAAWARGEQLKEGQVPGSTMFLEVEGELVGVYNFRHRLNASLERFGGHVGYSVRPDRRGRGHATELLRGAMAFGRTLGLEELVLTCAPENLASARVIEKCGGRVVERYDVGERAVLRWLLPL